MANYSVKDIYQGGYSSLKSDYGNIFTGYRISPSQIGVATFVGTPDVVQELNLKAALGTKTAELSLIEGRILDAIPKQYMEEAKRMAKLTGVDLTVHAPLLEPSGINQQGNFSESNRQAIEREMLQAVQRSHEVSPKGNIPVTFHSSTVVPGPEVSKPSKGPEEIKRFAFIDKESGQIQTHTLEPRHYPDEPEKLIKGEMKDPKKELDIINNSRWSNELTGLFVSKNRADQIISENYPLIKDIWIPYSFGQLDPKNLTQEQRNILSRTVNAKEFLSDTLLSARALFNKAWKFGTEEERKDLMKISENFSNNLYIEAKNEKGQQVKVPNPDLVVQSETVQNLLSNLEQFQTKQFKLLDDFAKEKSSETFGNIAFKAYKKYGDKAPIVSIENPPAGLGLSRGEDLKNLVEMSREKFVENAKKEGMSERDAKRAAEKLIGVTWDVGHINMIRKFGFSEKDVAEESKKIAPFLKHIHLSDNFGMEHTELPMGMGNVPFKEIMKNLGKKGFEAKKIIEAGDWWQHFGKQGANPPFIPTLQGLGSPIYGMTMAPYWNQSVGLQQGYLSD